MAWAFDVLYRNLAGILFGINYVTVIRPMLILGNKYGIWALV